MENKNCVFVVVQYDILQRKSNIKSFMVNSQDLKMEYVKDYKKRLNWTCECITYLVTSLINI